MTSSYAYESLSLDALKQWFSDMQKEVHVLGPLLPSSFGIKSQNGEEGSSVDIETFLGKMLLQHGERSVFFVRSLPSLFIYFIILLRFPLALTTGHQFRSTLTNCSNPLLQRKHHLYVYICHCFHPLVYESLNHWIRSFLVRAQGPHFRSIWQNESNHQVWGWWPNGPHSNLF